MLGAVASDGASIPRAMLALKAFDVGPSAVGWDWRPIFGYPAWVDYLWRMALTRDFAFDGPVETGHGGWALVHAGFWDITTGRSSVSFDVQRFLGCRPKLYAISAAEPKGEPLSSSDHVRPFGSFLIATRGD